MAPKQTYVWVVYERDADDDITFAGAYRKESDAEAEETKLKDGGSTNVAVEKVSLDANVAKKEGGKGKATAASKKGKEKSETPAEDADATDDGEEAAPTKPKKTAKKAATKDGEDKQSARKVTPEGKEGAFDNLTLLFTGTMNLDRPTMEKAAVKYGGTITKKLEETDWIILGKRPGDKKVEEINEKGLKTMTEDEFMEMLKSGEEPAGPPKKKVKT